MVFGRPEYAGIEPRPEFLFPVKTLTGDQFQLEPFDTGKHAMEYWKGTGSGSELYAYMGLGPFASKEDFIYEFIDAARQMPTTQLYAIMTTRKPKSGSEPADSSENSVMAGVAGYCEASRSHLKIEIGPVILLSQFQGIGLAPAVVELMVQNAFADVAGGGWGLRRVQWLAHSANVASIKLAQRLSFSKEAELKWDMRFPRGKSRGKIGNGRPLPPGSDPEDLGRDTVIYSRHWDD